MSWMKDTTLNWIELLAVKILKSGPVPKHVAVIMDGNRRYAEKKLMIKIEGHIGGFDTMTKVLHWCLHLGIPELTVYAFSIDNFKRSTQEIDDLMKLATQKFGDLLSDGKKVMEHGLCVRIIGDLLLLPAELRTQMAGVMLMTKDNNKTFLNIAFAYTTRNEVTHAVKTLVHGIENAKILQEDINEELISECLYTYKSPEPDLLIRTSGEVRFSEFLLWQTTRCCVYFTEVLWPDFNVWDMLAAVFYYQRCYSDLEFMKQKQKPNLATNNGRVNTFLNNLRKKRESMIENDFIGSSDS